jgi:hypothetical protein
MKKSIDTKRCKIENVTLQRDEFKNMMRETIASVRFSS